MVNTDIGPPMPASPAVAGCGRTRTLKLLRRYSSLAILIQNRKNSPLAAKLEGNGNLKPVKFCMLFKIRIKLIIQNSEY